MRGEKVYLPLLFGRGFLILEKLNPEGKFYKEETRNEQKIFYIGVGY